MCGGVFLLVLYNYMVFAVCLWWWWSIIDKCMYSYQWKCMQATQMDLLRIKGVKILKYEVIYNGI